MNSPTTRSLIALALVAVLLTAIPGYAQKPLADPRPLTGLDNSHIPTYPSIDAYLRANPRGDLLRRATPVGRATISTRSLPPTKALQALAGKTTQRLVDRLYDDARGLRVTRAPNGTASWLQGSLGSAAEHLRGVAKNAAAAYEAASHDVLEAHRHELRLVDPRAELRTMSVRSDVLGLTHARFEQVYRGVPVWGRDLYVHFDQEGGAYLINGSYEPTPQGAETLPAIEGRQALERVVTTLADEARWAPLPDDVMEKLDVELPQTRLVLYPDGSRSMRLAYEVTLHANLIERFTFLVDAKTGEEITRLERHCSLDHRAGPAPVIQVGGFGKVVAGRTGSGANTFLDAQGVDLNGVNQSLRVFQNAEGVYFSIWDLPNYNAATSVLPDKLEGGGVALSANNADLGEGVQLFHVTSDQNVWNDAAGVSAQVNMREAYDYYKQVHGRDAIDGKDQSIISILHPTEGGQPIDNAFWNGRYMIYGDGNQIFSPLAGALDVSGHEMTHGVVGHSAGLVYQFQSGALDESFADVFGVMIDREDFLLGEDIMLEGKGIALRDIENPANPQILDPQPAHMNQYENLNAQQDNGGVHINSGIPNRAAGIIIQAIGHDKTELIYYRALTNYLTRNSQFGDARKAVIQSASDLYGAGSAEATAAAQAFDAVGITDATTGGNTGETEPVPPQAGGFSLITFMRVDGTIGVLDMTDPSNLTVSFFESVDAVARANPEVSDFSQLSAPRSGERIWFVNGSGMLSVVDVQTGDVSVLQDVYLEQPGDLWTSSVDPEEGYVALVSAYAQDPFLYFFDGESISAIELRPETTQEGVYAETIQYPDVVSWSPNPQYPRLAFDAYNETILGEGTAAFWSMYEIDFDAQKIYSLISAQPTNISVGNITYSSTSPTLMAFNLIDEQGVFDVVLADFSAGETAPLGIPEYTIDGAPIVDAQRPTFAPNDALLALTTPQFGLLLFYDGEGLTTLDVGAPVYNPRWFVLGGQPSTDAEDAAELPVAVTLEGNYPNPFNPSTTLRFALPEAAEVRLEVFDLMGRRVETLLRSAMPPGEHEVSFDAKGLVSGTYVARLEAGGTVAVRKMILLR